MRIGTDAIRREICAAFGSSASMPEASHRENEFEKRLLAEVIPPSEIGVTFEDIGALETMKETLKELVILPLQRPELFCKGQLTKEILLFGPPGTGKTMLAKAVATEADANFINISMSSIASKWFGEGEKYVKVVFTLASKISPSVVFVDEDASPPKDPYIQVRVMDNIGEMLLDDQATTLLRNSIHFMKRTEAESLVSQGLLEEFNE